MLSISFDFIESHSFIQTSVCCPEIQTICHNLLDQIEGYITSNIMPVHLDLNVEMTLQPHTISFDGLSGVGKTHIIKSIQDQLEKHYLTVFVPQISADPITQPLIAAAKYVSQSGFYLFDPYIDPLVWIIRLLRKVDFAYQNAGVDMIIFDRYKTSTFLFQKFFAQTSVNVTDLPLAYQQIRNSHETTISYLNWLKDLLSVLPDPNLAFYLHCSTDMLHTRLKGRRRYNDVLLVDNIIVLDKFNTFALDWYAQQSHTHIIDMVNSHVAERVILQSIREQTRLF